MKELTTELIGYMNTADMFRGIHSRVHEQKIFSQGMLEQVRRGVKNFKDTPKNRVKVKRVIDAYENLIQERLKKLEVI